ncbi:MAG TPA: hypothetical protein VK589_28270 [Chryseolinea sp.]|nr:hypothetical protein [Chryseolinea sp.]
MKKFVGFFLYLFSRLIGRDINNEYKTKGKIFLNFSGCSKFLLTMGTDVETSKQKSSIRLYY